MIVAVDIGGTYTRIGWFVPERLRVAMDVRQHRTAEIGALREILRDYLQGIGRRPAVLVIGVAGPVTAGRSMTVNLPWVVDARELSDALKINRVAVLNDLEAAAHAIALLDERDWVTLQPGIGGAKGNRAVIAAGTGLGEAGLYWDGSRHHPFATEGGHTTFAPSNEVEDALHLWLRAQHGHVSWERLLSGPGIVNIYRFLRLQQQHPAAVDGKGADDRTLSPEAIAAAARDGDALSREAMRMFCRLYGAEAANLALKLMATGGVFVAGSIAVKNLPFLTNGEFITAFRAKGRMWPLLESIPVRVVTAEELVLLGAATYGARFC